jgi:hypothetical protein
LPLVEEVAVVILVEVVGVVMASPPAPAALETVHQQFPGKDTLEHLE